MRYAFVIDQDRCIGCHACTVACKEENQVPVGVFRTWVKYVEKGKFPDSSRHFGVLRCNHCDTAPCIEICPTGTLYRRADGIVDFDNHRCIGCKACMQACPYDALYIDPTTDTAAKCHYCAHRIEKDLEPACVIVCPTRAIIPGDLDDSSSQVSRIIAQQKVAVRKPEKGTDPKLFYLGVEADLLAPTRLQHTGTYFSSDRRDDDDISTVTAGKADWSGWTRETYDVPHPMPWGWKIATYLWTKSVSAGIIFVPAVALTMAPFSPLFRVLAPAIALAMLVITLALLVYDLKRPDRFFYLFTKPNLRSWLVLGSYILIAYGTSLAAWLFFGFREVVPVALRCITVLLGAGTAGYSAFLFAQAKGRDLWRSPMFLWHLLVHAVIAGAATLILASAVAGQGRSFAGLLSGVLVVFLLISFVMNLAELALRRRISQDFNLAMHAMARGRFHRPYWGLSIGLGLIFPLLLIALLRVGVLSLAWLSLAAVLALTGIWWFDLIWVKAGQVVPLS